MRDARPERRPVMAYETNVEVEAGEGITLRCRIDLLRRLPGGASELIDFKTSRGAAAVESTATQLLVYAAGVEQVTGERPAHLAVHNLASGESIPIAEDDAAVDGMRTRLQLAARLLRAGDFTPCLDQRRCEACDQQTLCPGGRPARVESAA